MFSYPLAPDIELRLFQPYHADEIFAVVDVNREHLSRWLPWVEGTLTAEDTRAYIHTMLHDFANRGDFAAGIWVDGNLAGSIGLMGINSHAGTAEIGYWLAKTFEGKGLMTKACKAVLRHAFETLKLNRIQIRVEPENTRSRAIPRRLGFKFEGTQRQINQVADRYIDLEVYSLLKKEWAAQHR